MLPGKTYVIEDILQILRTRFWVVVVPWAVIAAATAVAARSLPDMYQAKATIQVVPPQVPASIVRSLTEVTFQQRLQATQQNILSRTRLESIIQEFNLYQDERKSQMPEQVVENMRRHIKVIPVKGDAFTVEYIGKDPLTVLNVAQRLAGYFKEESTKEGERRAEGTNTFVQSAVEEARRKLEAVEEQLTQYKMRHAGELPEQLGANMQAIQTINMNLNSLAQSLAADQNAKAQLERSITEAETQTEPVVSAPTGPGTASTGTAAQRLAKAKAELADLQLRRRLKPDHPDVVLVQNAIKSLTKEAEEEALRAPVGAGVAVSPGEQARLSRLAAWREDLDRLKTQIEKNQAEQVRLRTLASTYQAKIDKVPTREAELVGLTREYATLNRIHTDLVAKREASSMSVNVERRQQGEQFNLIDPARLPERPSSPNRRMINLLGLIGGLAVGLGLVALLEYRDRTFKADYEVANVLSLPVLAVVPLMRSETERRAAFRKRVLLNVGLGSTVAVCLAVLAYSFVVLR